jgi:hypothetical protein
MGSFREHPGVFVEDWEVLRIFSLMYVELGQEETDVASLVMREKPVEEEGELTGTSKGDV